MPRWRPVSPLVNPIACARTCARFPEPRSPGIWGAPSLPLTSVGTASHAFQPPSNSSCSLHACQSARLLWRTKRLEPADNILDPHLQHLHILGVLGQHDVAFVGCDQKAGRFVCIQVAANPAFRLSPAQRSGYAFLPFLKQ